VRKKVDDLSRQMATSGFFLISNPALTNVMILSLYSHSLKMIILSFNLIL